MKYNEDLCCAAMQSQDAGVACCGVFCRPILGLFKAAVVMVPMLVLSLGGSIVGIFILGYHLAATAMDLICSNRLGLNTKVCGPISAIIVWIVGGAALLVCVPIYGAVLAVAAPFVTTCQWQNPWLSSGWCESFEELSTFGTSLHNSIKSCTGSVRQFSQQQDAPLWDFPLVALVIYLLLAAVSTILNVIVGTVYLLIRAFYIWAFANGVNCCKYPNGSTACFSVLLTIYIPLVFVGAWLSLPFVPWWGVVIGLQAYHPKWHSGDDYVTAIRWHFCDVLRIVDQYIMTGCISFLIDQPKEWIEFYKWPEQEQAEP